MSLTGCPVLYIKSKLTAAITCRSRVCDIVYCNLLEIRASTLGSLSSGIGSKSTGQLAVRASSHHPMNPTASVNVSVSIDVITVSVSVFIFISVPSVLEMIPSDLPRSYLTLDTNAVEKASQNTRIPDSKLAYDVVAYDILVVGTAAYIHIIT